MKKVFIFALCVLTLGSCKDGKTDQALTQNDSLRAIVAARDSEINEMMGTLNDIQAGFSDINAAEQRVTVAQQGENGSNTAIIRENIQFIAQRMAEQRELIKKLQQQLRETGFHGDELKKTIENLTVQLSQKDTELKKLRAELDAKNIHITELDQTITDLNKDVSDLNESVSTLTNENSDLAQQNTNLQNENTTQSQTISNQDKQLNTAWYVFGTKSELKDQHIITDGKVLQGSFNKNYFTKIDIRVTKEIRLYSKSATLLTTHPANSYTLAKDTSGQYVLRISDPQNFWSTSKYLVVQVK